MTVNVVAATLNEAIKIWRALRDVPHFSAGHVVVRSRCRSRIRPIAPALPQLHRSPITPLLAHSPQLTVS